MSNLLGLLADVWQDTETLQRTAFLCHMSSASWMLSLDVWKQRALQSSQQEAKKEHPQASKHPQSPCMKCTLLWYLNTDVATLLCNGMNTVACDCRISTQACTC